MKQRFDQVDANRSHGGTCVEGAASSQASISQPGGTVVTPAPTSGAWLSEALKVWCTDPHAAN